MSNKSIDWRAARSQMRNDRIVPTPAITETRHQPQRDPRAPGGVRYLLSSWKGLSGKTSYVFGPAPLCAESLMHGEPCVALALARDAAGKPAIISVRGDIHPDEASGWIDRVIDAGATELHLCRTGSGGSLSLRERLTVVLDLTADVPAAARAA